MGRDMACPNAAAAAAAAAAANTAKAANQLKVQVLLWKAGTRGQQRIWRARLRAVDFLQSVRSGWAPLSIWAIRPLKNQSMLLSAAAAAAAAAAAVACSFECTG